MFLLGKKLSFLLIHRVRFLIVFVVVVYLLLLLLSYFLLFGGVKNLLMLPSPQLINN